MTKWQSFPKAELHLHLDISLSYAGAAQLVPGLTQETYLQEFVAPEKCTDLTAFLSRVPRTLNLLQTEIGLRTLVRDVFEQLAADGIVYAELRFAPLQHMQQGLTAADAVRIVEAAVEQGVKDTGIEATLILCTLRHFSEDQSLETVSLIDQFRGSRVVAFDLAGDEANYTLTPHIAAFRYAHEHQIPYTSHAGEAAGPRSIWDTLYALQPKRIGHGVRSAEDAALVGFLRRAGVHLEMCPTCNVQLNVFPTDREHSINTLYQNDVSLSVSTDNRTLTPITLSREYAKLAQTFGWGKAEFLKCNVNALHAAFAPAAVKDKLLRQVREAYQG